MELDLAKALLGIVSIPALVAVNGFFVAAEFALVSVRKTELDELARAGHPRAASARRAVEHLDDAIAATQLGITIASLALGFIGEAALASLLDAPLARALPAGHTVLAHSLAAGLSLMFITTLHVVLGELAPKSVALQRPRAVALVVAGPLLLFARCTAPAIRVLNGLGALVLRLVGVPSAGAHARVHSPEELRMLVDETHKAGLLRADQAEAVTNLFRLHERKVREVMTPLARVTSLDLRAPVETLLEAARGEHTRLPAHEGDPSSPVGVMNTKELLSALLSAKGGPVDVTALLRAPVFIGPDAPVADLLRDMRRHRRPFVIVRDGATALGIVTLEDALEQIVGAIEQEQARSASPQHSQMHFAAAATPSTIIQIDVLRAELKRTEGQA